MLNNIKELRELRGLSISRLSKEMGITRTTLYRWECGGCEIRQKYWPKLADILQCSQEALFAKKIPACELMELANSVEQALSCGAVQIDGATIYWQQENLIRTLADALVQAIRSTPDINALHAGDAVFTKKDYDLSHIPEIEFD